MAKTHGSRRGGHARSPDPRRLRGRFLTPYASGGLFGGHELQRALRDRRVGAPGADIAPLAVIIVFIPFQEMHRDISGRANPVRAARRLRVGSMEVLVLVLVAFAIAGTWLRAAVASRDSLATAGTVFC